MAKKGVEEDLITRYGMTPLDFLMRTMVSPENEMSMRLDAAKSAAPYAHPRLKQIEIRDDTDRRRPDELEQDIYRFLAKVDESRRTRDLLGVIPSASEVAEDKFN